GRALLSACATQSLQGNGVQPAQGTNMNNQNQGSVIEVATFKLRHGIAAEFRPVDRAIEVQHVSKQPGFISREVCCW
ncbi:MAG: hypothetical protein ACREL7_00390, partial [Longimicrobiales bacterium]